MDTKETVVIDQVMPIAKKAADVTDEMARRVIALVRGISYEPHPRRKKFIMFAEAAVALLIFDKLLVGRAHRSK